MITCSKFENSLSWEGYAAFADTLYEKEEYRRALVIIIL